MDGQSEIFCLPCKAFGGGGGGGCQATSLSSRRKFLQLEILQTHFPPSSSRKTNDIHF